MRAQLLQVQVSIPEGVMVRELEGESVLLNLNSESYFGLDKVGTSMWCALTTSPSAQAAFERLLDEYEVEPEQLQTDLRDFIEKLSEAGLIKLSDD